MVRKTGLTACLLGALVLIAAACTPPTPTAPVAVIQASPTSGEAPFSVSFTSTSSSVPDPANTTWTWNFGAGEGTSTTSGSVSHQHSTVGTFTATLTLTSPAGTSTSDPVTITVNAPPPDTTYYVRADGVDSPSCGPIADPCQTIDYGQSRAVANPDIVRVRVAGGSYGAFTVK